LSNMVSKLERNGGELVSLEDPRLTHVVFDPEDTSRRLVIRQRVCRQVQTLSD